MHIYINTDIDKVNEGLAITACPSFFNLCSKVLNSTIHRLLFENNRFIRTLSHRY